MEQNKFYQIKNITEREYTLVGCDGSVITRPIQDVDRLASAFTIQDAKAGDVLTCYSDIKGQPIEQTGIIKQYVGRHRGCSNSFEAFFGVDWGGKVVIDGFMGSTNIFPSTKEQRDLLFQKMKEAGYEWYADKKELKKIEQPKLTEFEDAIKDMMDDYREAIDDNAATVEEVKERAAYLLSLIPQKSAEWSEEDEETLGWLCTFLKEYGNPFYSGNEENVIDWLKSLKDRVQQHPKQEWSEEDYRIFSMIATDVNLAHDVVRKGGADKERDRELAWLNFLRDRVLPQQKQEWSEEDIVAIDCAVEVLSKDLPSLAASIERLKSLKYRVQPQNMWISVDKEVYIKKPVLAQKKDKSDQFGGLVVCCDHTLTPNVYERYMILGDIVSRTTWKPSEEQMYILKWVANILLHDNGVVEQEASKKLNSLYEDLKKL